MQTDDRRRKIEWLSAQPANMYSHITSCPLKQYGFTWRTKQRLTIWGRFADTFQAERAMRLAAYRVRRFERQNPGSVCITPGQLDGNAQRGLVSFATFCALGIPDKPGVSLDWIRARIAEPLVREEGELRFISALPLPLDMLFEE